jgi:hypothetical protein
MKPRSALIIPFFLIAISCVPPSVSQEGLPPLEGFDWIVGCWLSRDGVVERWEPAVGPAISGSTLIPSADGSQVPQSLRVTTTETGGVSFFSRIGSQPARAFSLVSNTGSEAVFENSDDADLQKITYRREGDSLFIVLQTGDERGWETQFEPCANASPE